MQQASCRRPRVACRRTFGRQPHRLIEAALEVVAHLRVWLADRGDDPKAVHLYTALLGIATGLQMDWNEHSTPSVPQD